MHELIHEFGEPSRPRRQAIDALAPSVLGCARRMGIGVDDLEARPTLAAVDGFHTATFPGGAACEWGVAPAVAAVHVTVFGVAAAAPWDQ